jgi:hypothetical protein
MASFYEYLLSSLPMLLLGAKPPFEFEQFLFRCEELIPAEDFALLQVCSQAEVFEQAVEQPTLKCWITFERSLRNELVKLRASRKKIAPEKFLREGADDPALYHAALASQRLPSLVESEMMLDRERWQKLDELAFGHYFDVDALLVYGLKLQILLRWERINTADKRGQLAAVGV